MKHLADAVDMYELTVHSLNGKPTYVEKYGEGKLIYKNVFLKRWSLAETI